MIVETCSTSRERTVALPFEASLSSSYSKAFLPICHVLRHWKEDTIVESLGTTTGGR